MPSKIFTGHKKETKINIINENENENGVVIMGKAPRQADSNCIEIALSKAQRVNATGGAQPSHRAPER